jgi:acyl transferase domain-containing protein
LAAGRLERLAEIWVQGALIDWRQLLGSVGRRRLRLPGYPLAGERHWVERKQDGEKKEASASAMADPAAMPSPSLVVRGAAGDTSFHCFLRGDEACLSQQTVAGASLLPGLFYPELARLAGELAGNFERTVRGLRHLVWGRPLAITAPCELALTVQLTEAGANYRIAVVGTDNLACQVGELLWAEEFANAWPLPPSNAPGLDALADFRLARPAARGILAVARSVAGLNQGLQAVWSRPPGDLAMALDPLALDAVWQLIAFFEQQAGLPGPRFPLAVASLRFDGCVPDEGTIRVWQPLAQSPALSVLLIDQAGKPCLCLEGVVSEQLEALAELHFEGEAGQ